MTEHERIDVLVKLLEGNNAKAFCEKAGIPEASLSRVRRGRGRPETYYERILTAYPQVSRKWLFSEEGEPIKGMNEKGEILVKIESLEREVRRLAQAVEEMTKRCQ